VQSELVYRGRKVSAQEIEFIRQLIAAHPGLSRRRLSGELCAAWNWVQPNGRPRDMVARSLMLKLHRAGHIRLPAQRFCPPNNATQHRAPTHPSEWASAPLECSLAQLGALEVHQVRRTPAEKLFGSLMEAHHYLGYTRPVGEHLKYLIYAQGQPAYALTCLEEYLLGLQEQFFLRLAPARWFSQASGDSFPVFEHLFEGKPRSYGLDYLTEGEGKFPPAARVPRLLASRIPRGKVRAPGPEPCQSTTPRTACRRARLWRSPGPVWADGRVGLSA
jgi:hypothetical protein